MKKLFTSINFYLVCLAVLFTAYFVSSFFGTYNPKFEIGASQITEINHLDKDSLFTNYLDEKKHLQNDSIKKIHELQKLEQDYIFGYSDAYTVNGLTTDFIGFETISADRLFDNIRQIDNDSLRRMSKLLEDGTINKSAFDSFVKRFDDRKIKSRLLDDSLKNTSQNYLVLHNYTLKDNCTFFIKDNKNYLQYERLDSTKMKKNTQINYATYLHKEIPVLYLQSSKNKYPKETKLCIPLKNTSAKFFKTASMVWFFIMYLLFLYFLFLDIKIILNIAKGKAFINQNILYLKIGGYGSLILYCIFLLSPYVIHFIFRNTIPQEFIFSKTFVENIFSNNTTLITAVVELLLAKAFAKGSTLQTQSDLTI